MFTTQSLKKSGLVLGVASVYGAAFGSTAALAAGVTCTSIGDVVRVAANPNRPILGQGLSCLEGITSNLLSGALILIGIGAFTFLIVGGVKYITAGGDEKAIQSARKTIGAAIMGMALAAAAWFVLKVFVESLGLPGIIQFELPAPTV